MSPQHTQAFIIWAIALAIAFGFIYAIFSSSEETRHLEAHKLYQKGEKAQSNAEREESFNKALTLYKQVADDHPASHGTGVLEYNIANTYFELGQYPAAVLYYNKALKLEPWNDEAWENLQVALKKLQLPASEHRPWYQVILTPSLGMSVAQRFQLFLSGALAAFIFASVYIWKEIPKLKRYAYIFAALTFIVLLSLLASYYLEPTEAVVLRPTMLYVDAGKQYAKVQENPVAEGVKVEIIDLVQEDRWAKVRLPGGTVGYVPVDRIGAI